MWRTIRVVNIKSKNSFSDVVLKHPFSTASDTGGGKKLVVGIIAATGAGFAGAIVYGKYEPKFKKLLEENIPYIDQLYKLFPESTKRPPAPLKPKVEEKVKDVALTESLMKKKLDRGVGKEHSEVKSLESSPQVPDKATEQLITDLMKSLEKSSNEITAVYDSARQAMKTYTKVLYEALDFPEGKEDIWKKVKHENFNKSSAIEKIAEKEKDIEIIMAALRSNLKKLENRNAKNPLLKSANDILLSTSQSIEKAKADIAAVEHEAKTASEYQDLVKTSKEQFIKELQIILPSYDPANKDKQLSENDLNLLIAHAHRRIEQLQKQIAKQQITEKLKIEEAVLHQKETDEKAIVAILNAESDKKAAVTESAIEERVGHLKDDFEKQLRKQLSRQAAAHADHLQEVLKIQELEMLRKFSLELEEKLLHQKGVFISEVSGNMARAKGTLAYLKAKSEFEAASKKSQALWLACQAMNSKIESDNFGKPYSLGKEVATIKITADEDNEFVNSVLAGIPPDAVKRGVYNPQTLKERFHDVKKTCCKVALINENNHSLYRYILSHIQSFFIVESVYIPKEEIEGKVAVDPSEWDTYDILSRISYSLKVNNLEQALRYANQLKGEPKNVAKDWINEVRLLLETQLAVKALLAHAAAISIQAYH